jgi:hypothetical protein
MTRQHRTRASDGDQQEERMFERDRDPRREDDREVDVQDEDRGTTGGNRRAGTKNTGSRSQSGTGNRSGSTGQKKK